MNPIHDVNPVFSHDAIKYVYQESDMRMFNPANLHVKPFKTPPEKSKKSKKDEKNKEQNDPKEDDGGMFGLKKH